MDLHIIDASIIALYIIITIGIGFYLSKKASKDTSSYFLGGNKIPWYYLGLSNASGMFDISGTMWMVMLLFVYGLKSVWIPWMWPVFNQIFLMIFLSIWLRRSGVMTGAEWIKFRFGNGQGAKLAHLIVVIFAVAVVITYVAYGFIGIGKFASVFLPWELSANVYHNEVYYGLIITFLTTLYVVKGGMYSVVFTEVLQYAIMTIASIIIGGIAMSRVSPELLAKYIPDNWVNIFFKWELDLDWSTILPSANNQITSDGWQLFTAFFMMILLKGVLQSLAGPAPNYDMQRILSARSPKEASKMSALVNVVLIFPRYMLITGLAILSLVFLNETFNGMGEQIDFEMILPFAIKNFIPVGLMGVLLAGLLAAFMSSFAAAVNTAPAYLVNDIYKNYININASEKRLIKLSYVASVGVVILGITFAMFLTSLTSLIDWFVSALYGGYAAANLLKWYWWRFNGNGYYWGMMGGILAAATLPLVFTEMTALEAFPLNLAISFTGCIIGTYMKPSDDIEVLKKFYLKTRPWGFWKPIHDALLVDFPDLNKNDSFLRDMSNCAIGMIWQTALTALPIFFVIQDFPKAGIAAAIIIVTSIILKKNWYDKLEDYPDHGLESLPKEDQFNKALNTDSQIIVPKANLEHD